MQLQILKQPHLVSTHQQTFILAIQNTPPSPHPIRLPQVSGNDSNYSDNDGDTVTTQSRVLQQPPRVLLPPPRVQPIPTTLPSPRQTITHSPPAHNTGNCIQSITQETLLHLLHYTAPPLATQQTTIRCFLQNVLAAILDTDTVESLEYCHLIRKSQILHHLEKHKWKRTHISSPGHPQLCQGNQHYCLHPTQQNSSRLSEGSYLWTHMCKQLT